MKIKIVGFDISLSNLGIAKVTLDLTAMKFVVDDLTLVKTEPETKAVKKKVRQNSLDLERSILLHDGMVKGCQDAALAICEVPVGSQSARAMASYGISIGVLAACPIPLIQVTPTEVKLAGYGEKTATKDEMIEWATEKYPTANWLRHGGRIVKANEHLADAVAAIEAGIATEQFRQATALFARLKAA